MSIQRSSRAHEIAFTSQQVTTGAVSSAALTPLSFLERSARVWPGKVAVIYGSRRLTYSEFAAEAVRVARALRASGVEPGTGSRT